MSYSKPEKICPGDPESPARHPVRGCRSGSRRWEMYSLWLTGRWDPSFGLGAHPQPALPGGSLGLAELHYALPHRPPKIHPPAGRMGGSLPDKNGHAGMGAALQPGHELSGKDVP